MSFGDEKYIFKLIINSTFGKTMENLRKKIKVRLLNNVKIINLIKKNF